MSRKVFWIHVEECQGLKPEPYKYSQSSRVDISVWVRESVALVHKVQKVFWVAYMSESNKPERLNLLIILNILAKILFWCEFQTADPSIFEYLSHQCTMKEFSRQACHQEVLKTEIETDHSVCSSTNTAYDFRGLMMVPVKRQDPLHATFCLRFHLADCYGTF